MTRNKSSLKVMASRVTSLDHAVLNIANQQLRLYDHFKICRQCHHVKINWHIYFTVISGSIHAISTLCEVYMLQIQQFLFLQFL